MGLGYRILLIVCTLMGLVIADANRAQAAPLFSDGFETGAAGATIGPPWGLNGSVTVTSTYVNGANPFPNGGAQYADLNDADSTPVTGATIRLLSHAGVDLSLQPFVSGQISTYSFNFLERAPNEAIGGGMIVGYYRQQTNPDLNGAGRNYSSNLHDGSLNPVGALLGGAALTYTTETVNTIFMIVNDSATSLVNYQPGRTLADTSADFWLLRPGDASPVWAFSVDKQSILTAVAGVGLRTNSGDAERFSVDNVLVMSGATFDRTAFAPPCSLGDVNCDDAVDVENDFEAIRANFRRNVASRSFGDLTADGLVSLSDFVQWKSAFLGGGGSLDGVSLGFLSVPEPSTATIAGVMMWSLIGCRWRRGQASGARHFRTLPNLR